MTSFDTRREILEAARSMVRARGYNSLSFRDIAAQVGIKSASVHYHFPTKGDLAAELVRTHTDAGKTYLTALLVETATLASLLQEYTNTFRADLSDDNRMCLCGIMIAEHENLPEKVRSEVRRFMEANVTWLSGVLERYGSMEDGTALRKRARSIHAAVQGAQLVARGSCDVGVYDELIESFKSSGLFK